jgi:hypothetical protein
MRFQPSAVRIFLGPRGVADLDFSGSAFLGSVALGFFLKKREIIGASWLHQPLDLAYLRFSGMSNNFFKSLCFERDWGIKNV